MAVVDPSPPAVGLAIGRGVVRSSARSLIVIQAVHPVGVSVPTACHALVARRGSQVCPRVASQPLADVGPPRLAGKELTVEALADQAPFEVCSLSDRDALAKVEPWEPWPAHEAFADEKTRWWPSDDYPPTDPPVVIEDRIPDPPIEIVDWRDRGGLLNTVI